MSNPPFVMSKYATREALLADAASYYEAECEALRKRVKDFEAGQGEPVAWFRSDTLGSVVRVCQRYPEDGFTYQPLYISAPTIPEGWTQREIELFDGMIEVETYHAERCDRIANRVMAEKQKGWDLERVALLRKCKAMLAAAPKPKEKHGA